MRLLYHPTVNVLLRNVLRPLRRLLPRGLQFPVTGQFSLPLPGGKSILINSNPTSYIAKVLFWQGFGGFEPVQAGLFVELIRDAGVFVDVGANIGYYSLLAAAYNPAARICAFEPLPSAAEFVRKNAHDNGFSSIEINRVALSDKAGEATFFVPRNPKFHYIANQLTSTGSLSEKQGRRSPLVDEVRVQTMRLDDWVRDQKIDRIDVMKLDTEATEHLVLKGAHEVLRNHRPIIFCEVLPGKIENELDSIFSEYGYLKFRLENGGLLRVEELSHNERVSNDHVMVHEEQYGRIERFLGDSNYLAS